MSLPPRERISYHKEAGSIRRTITLNASIARAWRALATAEGLASWLLPNNFQPIVGAHFHFTAEPQEDWDGIIECQVIEMEKFRRLAFTWSEMSELAPTLVTFELRDLDGKTEVCLVHSRRERLPEGYVNRLDQGWSCDMLLHLTATLEQISA